MNEIHNTYGKVILNNMEEVQDTRTVTFELSNEMRNRSGKINRVGNWKIENFNANGIVGYQHNVHGKDMCNPPNPDDVIANGVARIDLDSKKLMMDATFETKDINPQADKVFQKLTVSKTLRTVSPGFIEVTEGETVVQSLENGDRQETYIFGQTELLEASVVNIPMNAKALKQSFRDSTYNALMYVKNILGGAYSFADIEKMSVRNVLDLVEKPGEITEVEEEEVTKNKILIEKTKRKLKLLEYEI